MDPITSLSLNPTVPYEPFAQGFTSFGPAIVVSQYNGWRLETDAWKKTCYISGNLSGIMGMQTVKGPDALKLMNDYFVNNFTKMPIGAGRHGIMVTRKGNVIEHGMVLRLDENEFGTYAFQPYLNYITNSGKYNVEPLIPEPIHDFVYQLAGPRSLEIIENAAKQDLHDLKFMRFCSAAIAGRPVRIIRMGMGGTLSYEVHGKLEDSHDVYNAIVEVGTPYGIQKLGWLSYQCNHTENGFPQIGQHFPYPFIDEPEFLEYSRSNGFILFDPTILQPMGSLSDDINDYFRNPLEIGWGHSVKFDHDFHGKDALEKIAASAHRKVVTLEWNSDDVVDIFASNFKDGEQIYKQFPLPFDQFGHGFGNSQDKVLDKTGNFVGISMQPIYTNYYKKVISLGIVDPGNETIGTEVQVLWGNKGDPIKRVNATVARYPYLDLSANRDYDMESIPRYKG